MKIAPEVFSKFLKNELIERLKVNGKESIIKRTQDLIYTYNLDVNIDLIKRQLSFNLNHIEGKLLYDEINN